MIEICNISSVPVDKKFFLGVAKKVAKGENRELEHISIAFVSAQRIRQLNKAYRKKDKPTDVLSFARVKELAHDVSEVVLCPQVIAKRAKMLGVAQKRELAKSLIHGMLHNFGYDHEKSKQGAWAMEEKEQYYFSKIF